MAEKHEKLDSAAGLRSAVQRRHDHAAEMLRLQDALREARLRGEELQAHCDALERSHREALAALAAADARAQACREETAALRRQFEARIAELRNLQDSLRPPQAVAASRDGEDG